MSVVTLTTQYEAEQALASALYHFGEALTKQGEPSSISQLHQQLHQAMEQLIVFPNFARISERLDLNLEESKLLSMAYISAIEPDVSSGFINLSWYEQGPTISLQRAWNLCQYPAEPSEQIQHISLAELFNKSALFAWRLLAVDDSRFITIQPLILAWDVVEQLSTNTSIPVQSQPDSFNQEPQQYVSALTTYLNPSHKICYPALLLKGMCKFNLLGSVDELETLPFVLSLAAQKNATVCHVVSELTIEHNPDVLISQLRQAALAKSIPLLYWPEFFTVVKTYPIYWKLLHKWLGLTEGLFVAHQPSMLEESEQSELQNHDDAKNDLIVKQHIDQIVQQYDLEHEYLTSLTIKPVKILASAWSTLSAKQGNAITPAQATQLATLYPMSPSQIGLICERVKNQSNAHGQLFESLQKACLAISHNRHPNLAVLTTPKASLNHMVLPEETEQSLNELVLRVQHSETLKRQVKRFVPGVHALFWGKPGTGKTMAAEAMAAELKLPMYKVNLANIASKWIGETEKHLAKLFDEAQAQNAVLLFDEADAIFAKRSEVSSSHDKNANMGVSFLLQRMETYTGLLLLSTNFKSNLDDAFLRRFHGVVEFPMPDEEAREQLWQQAWPGSLTPDNSIKNNDLAKLFEFSPAQIRNIAERSILYAVASNEPTIKKPYLALAIVRELNKQGAGYMAEQTLKQWAGEIPKSLTPVSIH